MKLRYCQIHSKFPCGLNLIQPGDRERELVALKNRYRPVIRQMSRSIPSPFLMQCRANVLRVLFKNIRL
jgi:hypothetical protein